MVVHTVDSDGGRHPYRLQALLAFPRRIFRPPDSGVRRVGRVKPLSLTPVYEVKLEDVLAGKHLPPLTLFEFEAYLLHVERSPENLHFLLWFGDYERQYTKWTHSSTYPLHSPLLAENFSKAQQTFFSPSSFLQLNLPEVTVAALHGANPHKHPPPSAFADIRHQVETLLRQSLDNFVRSRTANTGRNRGIVAIFCGLSLMCIGIAPILISMWENRSKWLRLAAFPCFWYGSATVACALNGVCVIIYLFGDARQLAVYELAGPRLSNKVFSRHKNTPSKGLSTVSSNPSQPVDYVKFSPPKTTHSAEHIAAPGPEASEWNLVSESGVSSIPSQEKLTCELKPEGSSYPPSSSSSPVAIAPFLSTPPGSPLETMVFDFDQLTSRMIRSETDLASRSPPVFAPLTKTLDRISIRTYWETFMRSLALGFLVACILVGVSFAGT